MHDEEQLDVLLRCPECGTETDSLKQYRYMRWCLFLLAGAVWQDQTIRACPSCVRRRVGKSLLVNLIPANLLWPILILPWGLGLLVASSRKGHSKIVEQMVALEEAEMRQATARPANIMSPYVAREQVTVGGEEVSWHRVSAALALILFWLPVLGLVMALVAYFTNRRQEGSVRTLSVIALWASGVIHAGLLGLFVYKAWFG